MLAPSLRLPGSRIEVDVPVMVGMLGGGFYLSGPDRDTPDGRRVSEWENELFEGKDAAFAPTLEAGIRALVSTKNPGIKWGVGVHYITTQGWETPRAGKPITTRVETFKQAPGQPLRAV